MAYDWLERQQKQAQERNAVLVRAKNTGIRVRPKGKGASFAYRVEIELTELEKLLDSLEHAEAVLRRMQHHPIHGGTNP
jgi:hypothetical protein